jgi:hypothetical protein
MNKNSAAYSPELDSMLTRVEKNLSNPSVDRSVQGIKSAVSTMESDAADLSTSNRYASRILNEVKSTLDKSADQTASSILGPGDATLKNASDFYKQNIVPFRDSSEGLGKIMSNPDADKSIKAFLSDSSPDQFSRLYSLLDSRGKEAVKAALINEAVENATSGRSFDNYKFAKYLSNRISQLDSTVQSPIQRESIGKLQGLINLI